MPPKRASGRGPLLEYSQHPASSAEPPANQGARAQARSIQTPHEDRTRAWLDEGDLAATCQTGQAGLAAKFSWDNRGQVANSSPSSGLVRRAKSARNALFY